MKLDKQFGKFLVTPESSWEVEELMSLIDEPIKVIKSDFCSSTEQLQEDQNQHSHLQPQ